MLAAKDIKTEIITGWILNPQGWLKIFLISVLIRNTSWLWDIFGRSHTQKHVTINNSLSLETISTDVIQQHKASIKKFNKIHTIVEHNSIETSTSFCCINVEFVLRAHIPENHFNNLLWKYFKLLKASGSSTYFPSQNRKTLFPFLQQCSTSFLGLDETRLPFLAFRRCFNMAAFQFKWSNLACLQ